MRKEVDTEGRVTSYEGESSRTRTGYIPDNRLEFQKAVLDSVDRNIEIIRNKEHKEFS